MKVYYDTEFIEDGRSIELISIGMVTDDGREYYAVNRDAPWRRIKKHEWLMANVVPYLPKGHGDYRLHMPKSWLVDFNDERVKTRHRIAEEVQVFLLGEDRHDVPDIELWAWYGAYDHVCLAQLWGRMIDLPPGIPMWTNDLRQEVRRLGDPPMPDQESGLHNALADARHLKVMADHLAALEPDHDR
jgi:hypothetical protein